MPDFFVPMVEVDKQEAVYVDMAKYAGAAPAAHGQRICSLTWKHDNTVWTATVGEQFRGVETVVKGRGRNARYMEIPRQTSDTVLAIYAGHPYLIMHDNKSRYWNVPILAGNVSQVVHFTS